LIIMAMIPKVGAIIALMPSPVLGGVLLFMFGMVASVGLDIIGRHLTSRPDALISARSLAVGRGIQAAPPAAVPADPPPARGVWRRVRARSVRAVVLPTIRMIVWAKGPGPTMARRRRACGRPKSALFAGGAADNAAPPVD